MDAPERIISDEDVIRVHGYANFGDMSPREVLADGVRKYAIGYTSGHTQLCILLEHGLITKPKPGKYSANLTKKGKRYARAISNNSRAPMTVQSAAQVLLDASDPLLLLHIPLWPHQWRIVHDGDGGIVQFRNALRALAKPAEGDKPCP